MQTRYHKIEEEYIYLKKFTKLARKIENEKQYKEKNRVLFLRK